MKCYNTVGVVSVCRKENVRMIEKIRTAGRMGWHFRWW